MLLFKFKLLPTDRKRQSVLKQELADILRLFGFTPGHWAANWKKLGENVWLLLAAEDRCDPRKVTMTADLLFRDTPPNAPGKTFQLKDKEQHTRFLKTGRKLAISILLETGVKYIVDPAIEVD